MATLGRTARFYRKNRASYLKKLAKANSHPVWGEQTEKRKKKRGESNYERWIAKKNGKNIDGKDYDHKTGTFMDSSKNRGQREKSRLKGSKRADRELKRKSKRLSRKRARNLRSYQF